MSALRSAAEAALRWAEVWLPWSSVLERRDGKPFLRERSGSRGEKGVALRERGRAALGKPLLAGSHFLSRWPPGGLVDPGP